MDIRGARLRAARVLDGLTTKGLSERLPRRDRVSRVQITRWENARDRSARAHVVEALARVLGVTPAWLRGDTSIPIASSDPWIQALDKIGQKHGGEWDHLELRRWRALARCVEAAQRDYQQIEGRKPDVEGFEGWVWARFETLFQGRWLTTPTRALPSDGREPDPWFRVQAAHVWQERIVRVLSDGREPAVPEGEGPEDQRCQEEALLGFWEVVLRPWWEGRIGFDYRYLNALPLPAFREERSSPGELFGLPPDRHRKSRR